MSPSELIPLSVQTEDPETEIFISDGKFRLKARGLGMLREVLRPGLYTVKVHTGARIREHHIALRPDNEAVMEESPGVSLARDPEGWVMRFSRMPFTTAVPLPDVSWARDAHTREAIAHSREVHVRLGGGGELFVFSRSWSRDTLSPQERRRLPPVSFQLSLHDLQGERLVDLTREGARDLEAEDPWAACNIALAPGAYRLRLRTEAGLLLERLAVVSPGWQTQAFLCQVRERPTKPTQPSPANGSVHMRRLKEGFCPERPGMRMTELARIGLRNRRAVLSPELLQELRDTESRNPMLGLYGTHLLMLAEAPDLRFIRFMVETLRAQLGLHPDVEALALGAGMDLLDDDVFEWPTMLLRSWSLLVKETPHRPWLVRRGSLASRVADRLWGNSPWLIWKAPTAESPFRASLSALEGQEPPVAELVRELQAVAPGRLARLDGLTPIERSLLTYLRRGPSTIARAALDAVGEEADELEERLVLSFGVPLATLHDALLGLAQRVGLWEGVEGPAPVRALAPAAMPEPMPSPA